MDILHTAIIIAVAVVGGLAAIGIMLKLQLPIPWMRKITHLSAMALVIFFAALFGYKLFITTGLIFAILLLLMRFIRPPKALTGKETLDSYGESIFFVGVAATAFIASSLWLFIIPIAILGLADTAAYVIGRSIPSPKLIFSKTLAGSLAFIVVAFCLFLIVAPLWLALVGAVVTSFAELIGTKGSDNVTVPVVAVLLLTFA